MTPTERFAALACNAFGVMMRRKWHVEPNDDGTAWRVWSGDGVWWYSRGEMPPQIEWPDPFTALVEADKWYVENVESKAAK